MGPGTPLRVASIGVGHWHALYDAAYLKTLVRMPDVRLVGVHDPDAALAAQRSVELGGPAPFTDYREMLRKTRPDFVIVLGRHSEMAEAAHCLLDEGLPFLIEKPMGINAEQVRAIAEKARTRQAFVAVPLFQRHHPFVCHAERMLAEGAFGAVSHFSFRSNRGSSARYVAWGAPWMLERNLAGGGCLRNIGLHGIDAFIHLFREQPEVTGADMSSRAHGATVEDYAAVVVRAPSGVIGVIEAGNTFPGQGADAEWKIAGRDALLLHREGALRCITARGEQHLPVESSDPLPAVALQDALTRWREGKPPRSGPDDCYRAMQVVDEAYVRATSRG